MNDFVQLFNKLTQTKYHANTTFFFYKISPYLNTFRCPAKKKKYRKVECVLSPELLADSNISGATDILRLRHCVIFMSAIGCDSLVSTERVISL